MSVLIKDMDMPKEGVYNAVITFDGDSISVRIPPSKKPFFSGRIVHMPTPHGRLIDADKLKSMMEHNHCNSCDNYSGARCLACWVDDCFFYIDDIPEIIEAEVSE